MGIIGEPHITFPGYQDPMATKRTVGQTNAGTATRPEGRRPNQGTVTAGPNQLWYGFHPGPSTSTPGAGGATHSPGKGNRTDFDRDAAAGREAAAAAAPPGNPYGSQSGPGILESWFNQRASGTDPAFNYAAQRGMEGIGNQFAAAGGFNSGAARRQESDFYANLVSQRMGQLDALAGGASGEHMGRIGMMFNQGLGVAGGQAGLSSAYDLGAAGNMDAANRAQMQLNLNKAGVDSQANQGGLNNILAFYNAYNAGGNRK